MGGQVEVWPGSQGFGEVRRADHLGYRQIVHGVDASQFGRQVEQLMGGQAYEPVLVNAGRVIRRR